MMNNCQPKYRDVVSLPLRGRGIADAASAVDEVSRRNATSLRLPEIPLSRSIDISLMYDIIKLSLCHYAFENGGKIWFF